MDDDLRGATTLLCPFAYAGSGVPVLMFALLFLRKLLRKEGMTGLTGTRGRESDYGLIGEAEGARETVERVVRTGRRKGW